MPPHPAPTSPTATADLVEALKLEWREGVPPDAARALREHPELLEHRSLAVDLVYEEYCLLEEAGHTPEPEEFCQRVPAFASQVREVIRGHRVFTDNPGLFPEADWPQPGDDFEGCTVVGELGRGAFARAYLARDPATGDRPVALKLSRFPSGEACTLGVIAHPHVVSVHWARQIRGLHAVCMPFVGATTLGDVIAATFRQPVAGTPRSAQTILRAIDAKTAVPVPPFFQGRESYPDAVARVVARLAGALAHLHQSRVSHGDLKPSNIVLAPGGHPYLIDFNLATGPNALLLRLGGTLPYMAPERIQVLLGETLAGDPAPTDVYSLGAVLFEALAGRVPFPPAKLDDPAAVARPQLQRLSGAAPDVAAVNPEVPQALARIVARCLAANPSDRPSAEALERALDRFLRRRQRVRRFLACAGMVAITLTTVALVIGAPAPVPERAVVQPFEATPGNLFRRGVEYLRAGDVAAATKDFGDARRLRADGQNTAFLAYCSSRAGSNPAAAITLYDEAIKKYDYRPAWVHSNRADSLIRSASPQNLQFAINEADAALALDPKLRAARLNRAQARFLSGFDPKTRLHPNPEAYLADLDGVMAEGPYNSDLYYKAALMLTAGAAGREDRYARAVTYLREAVRLGRDPKRLASDRVLEFHLAKRKDFERVTQLPPAEHPEPLTNLHVVDPTGR